MSSNYNIVNINKEHTESLKTMTSSLLEIEQLIIELTGNKYLV